MARDFSVFFLIIFQDLSVLSVHAQIFLKGAKLPLSEMKTLAFEMT